MELFICFQCSFYYRISGMPAGRRLSASDQSQNYLADKSYLTQSNLFAMAYLFPDRHSITLFFATDRA